jgi:hypothetical protein
LHGFDVTLDARELALDLEQIGDRSCAVEQRPQADLLGLGVRKTRREIDVLLRDIRLIGRLGDDPAERTDSGLE